MRAPGPGNRLVVGESGVVFEVQASVASGLVGNKSAQYVDGAEAAPAAPSHPVPETGAEADVEQSAPKRRGRPPKAAAAVEDAPEQ